MSPGVHRRAASRLATAAAGLLVAGVVVSVVTGQALPVVLPVLLVATTAIARWTGWRVSVALVVLGSMIAEVCLLWVTPLLSISVHRADLALWTVAGAAGVVVLATYGPPALTRPQVETGVLALAVPVTGVVFFLWEYLASDRTWIGWSMHNDVTFRSLLARWTLQDQGLTQARGYSDPLTSALVAAWSAGPAGGGRVGHEVRAIAVSSAQLSVLLWLAVSCLTSLIALRHPGGGRLQRLLLAVIAGLLPWTWFIAGSSFALGFQNVAPVLLVVLAAWILWTERLAQPVVCLAGLIGSILAAAMAWAPLAVVPLFWAAHLAVSERARFRALPRKDLRLPAAVLGLGVVYALAVTVPATLGSGTGGLSGDGAIQHVKWRVVLGVVAGAVVLSLLFARKLSATHRWGLWCATAASALVVAYLLFERRDKDLLWGYYPIKFTWLVVSAALLIGFGEVAPVLGRLFRRVWGGVGVAVAGALVITAMYQVTAPWYPGSRFTPFALEQERTYDRAANAVFKILDKHPRSFVMGYSRDQFTGLQEDGFINFWLFQMAAKDGDDDIRNLAYHFDPTDVRALCDDVVAAWGDAAWVWTRNPSVATQFETSCRPGQVTVRLHGRLLRGGAG